MLIYLQRNPGTIRQAEDDKGIDYNYMNLIIDIKKSSVISPHITNICANTSNIFTRDIDIESFSKNKGMLIVF